MNSQGWLLYTYSIQISVLLHIQSPLCVIGIFCECNCSNTWVQFPRDHIQEWSRLKRFIKSFIPLEFLLEWFLKSLLPYIAKDVSTSGVQNEEQAIFRAQELDLIYAQSELLYEIIRNAP